MYNFRLLIMVTGLILFSACTGPRQATHPVKLRPIEHPEPDTESRWESLVTPNLSHVVTNHDMWVMEDGILHAPHERAEGEERGQRNLWTKEIYGDFILDFDFKMAKGGNSGVFLRNSDMENWLHNSIEIQLKDSYEIEEVDKGDCGAIYDLKEPRKNLMNPPGEWNHMTILAVDSYIMVILNGEIASTANLSRWTEARMNPDGTENKFNKPMAEMPRKGRIGLQYHGHPDQVWFRNIWIRPLD